MRNVRVTDLVGLQAMILLVCMPGAGVATACVAPYRPFLPDNSQATLDYADLIRTDFENYIEDIQRYFHCLEDERARAFAEARKVSEEYGRFLKLVGN